MGRGLNALGGASVHSCKEDTDTEALKQAEDAFANICKKRLNRRRRGVPLQVEEAIERALQGIASIR